MTDERLAELKAVDIPAECLKMNVPRELVTT
jgi:hypothetical protein